MDRESRASSGALRLTQNSFNYVQSLSKTYVVNLKREGELLVLLNMIALYQQF